MPGRFQFDETLNDVIHGKYQKTVCDFDVSRSLIIDNSISYRVSG